MSFEYATVLTGGIATGKSTVAKIFESYGFSIVDADKIAHSVLQNQYKKIEELFGSQYVEDGIVNRKALGGLIFSNHDAKLQLESLLHPLIFEEIERQSLLLDSKKEPYLVDIPLFFETNRYPIKESLVVYIPQELQLKRLIQRDNITQALAQQRIDSQMDIEKKRQKATYLIDNQGDMKALQQQCDRVKDKIIDNYKKGK